MLNQKRHSQNCWHKLKGTILPKIALYALNFYLLQTLKNSPKPKGHTVQCKILRIKYVVHEIVNWGSDLGLLLALPAVICVSLPQGKHNHQSADPPIRPSIVPRSAPGHS